MKHRLVSALLGELGKKVFVDAAEDVARGRAQRFGIELAHHAFKKFIFEARVIFGNCPASGGKRSSIASIAAKIANLFGLAIM